MKRLLRINDESIRVVNLEPYAKRRGIFSRLADKRFFKKFFIDLNTLCWPNGADIAPERLYEIGVWEDDLMDWEFAFENLRYWQKKPMRYYVE